MSNDTFKSRRRCDGCRYWDRLSIDANDGDCRAPENHRYSRARFPDGTVAMLDSFGPEQTRAQDVCGAWRSALNQTATVLGA